MLDGRDRQLQEARTGRTENLRLAGRQEAVATLAGGVVLDDLARESLGNLT